MMQGAGLVALLSGLAAWGLTGDGDEAAADEWRLFRRREGYDSPREVLLQWTTYEDVRKGRRRRTSGHACVLSPILKPKPTNPSLTQWRALVAKTVEWIWVVRRIVAQPEVASLFLADSLVYFVIKGLADWSVLALTETKGLAEKEAVGVFFYCELGAIAGSFASGKGQAGRLLSCGRRLCLPACLPAFLPTHPLTYPLAHLLTPPPVTH